MNQKKRNIPLLIIASLLFGVAVCSMTASVVGAPKAVAILSTAALLVLLAAILVGWWNSPEGFEDSTGFHYGKPEKK